MQKHCPEMGENELWPSNKGMKESLITIVKELYFATFQGGRGG